MEKNIDFKIRAVLQGNGIKEATTQLNAVTEISKGMLTGVSAVRRATEEFDRALTGLTPVELLALNQGFEMLRADLPPASAEAQQLASQIKSVDAALDQASKKDGLSGVLSKASDAARNIPIIGPAIEAISNPAVAAAGAVGLLAFRMGEAAGKADDLQDKAERFGVSAKMLQTIGNTAGLDGKGIDSVTTALGKLTQTTQAAANGSKPLNEAFDRLGLSVEEIKNMSPEQVFLEVADAVANSTDKNQAYADVVSVMGRGAGELFATLQRGKQGILETGEAFGGFADDATIKRLADARENLEKLNNQFTMFAGNLAGDALNLSEQFSTKPVETYVAAVSGLVSQLSGGLFNPDGLSQLDWLKEKLGVIEESAPVTAEAISKVTTSADDLDAQAAAQLAEEIKQIEEASSSAERAVSDLANASSQLDQLTAKLQDVQKAAELAEAKRNRDSGQSTDSEYQTQKAAIENKYRELEASQAEAKIAEEIAAKEQAATDLKAKAATLTDEAKAKAEEELVMREKEIELLHEKLAKTQQINNISDRTADANAFSDIEQAGRKETASSASSAPPAKFTHSSAKPEAGEPSKNTTPRPIGKTPSANAEIRRQVPGAQTRDGVTYDRDGNPIRNGADLEQAISNSSRQLDGSLSDSRLGGDLGPRQMPRTGADQPRGGGDQGISNLSETVKNGQAQVTDKLKEATEAFKKGGGDQAAAVAGLTQTIVSVMSSVVASLKQAEARIANLQANL